MMLYLRGRLCLKYLLVIILIDFFQSYEMFEIYLNDLGHTTINDVCTSSQGRLLSYEDISSTSSQKRVMELLQDGESARIAGVPRFFKSISYYGCYNVSDLPGVKRHSLQKRLTLYHCIDECFDDYQYAAGILNEQCFCFGRYVLDNVNDKLISATDCTETRAALFYNNSTQYARNQLVVYLVPKYTDNTIKTPLEAHNTFKQCQFVQINEDNNISRTTAKIITKSCSSKGDLNGFICKMTPPLEKCNKKHERLIKQLCLVDKEVPYIVAETYCMNKGRLLYHKVHSNFAQNLEQKSVYLLDGYTNFQIFERTKDHTEDSIYNCVSVRKSIDTLLIEAYKCTVEMKTLCYHETDKTSNNGSSKVNGANVTETMSDVDYYTPANTELVPENDSKSIGIPTIIGLSVGCVVFVTIILTIIITRLVKGNRRDTEPNQTGTNVDNDIDLGRYRRDPPPGPESNAPYYEYIDYNCIGNLNQQNDAGIQTVYEQLDRRDEETNAYTTLHSPIDNATCLDESGYLTVTNGISE